MSNPLIINFTPTGMIPTKEMTPHVPISVNEIIEQVHQAHELGITLTHLHARAENGQPTYKAEIYEKIVNGVRKHCPDLVICLSLSGRNFPELEKRAEPLDLDIDMGSLTLSSLNFPRTASVNSPSTIEGLCKKMLKRGIHPELEVFDLGMINYAKYLHRKGLIKGPYYFNIILDNIAGMQVDFSHIGTAIKDLPNDSVWALGGIGIQQLAANAAAIALGGGVRVGLEDNIFYDQKRSQLATNLELIKRIHRLANEFERPIMKPNTFGNMGFYRNKSNE